MQLKEIRAVQKQLLSFVDSFRDLLGRSERRHWCGMYLSGLLMDGERKSIQPVSARLPGGNEQALQQFVNQSPWAFEPVQERLTELLIKKLKPEEPGVLILDDTTFPKKGNASVGVGRQYCGALGKVANCQSLVSWQFANEDLHFPVKAELYLPKSWCDDRARMKKSGVPDRRFEFQEKWKIALDLLDQIKLEKQFQFEAILCDAGYGEIKEFLRELNARKIPFVAQVPESHCFWPEDVKTRNGQKRLGRPREYPEVCDKEQKPPSAAQWAKDLSNVPAKWKKVKLPLRSKKSVMATAVRVREVISKAYFRPGYEAWLIIEQFGDGFKFYVSSFPKNTPLEKMVRLVHIRWKIEQGYQHLKEELGMDHFEGRSWAGFHHHVTLSFMAYGLLLLLKNKGVIKKSLSHATLGEAIPKSNF
jgi:SRSO17 transposase